MASFNRNVAWRIVFQAVSADKHPARRLRRGGFEATTVLEAFRPSQARHGTSPSDWRTGCLTSIDFADRRWAGLISLLRTRGENVSQHSFALGRFQARASCHLIDQPRPLLRAVAGYCRQGVAFNATVNKKSTTFAQHRDITMLAFARLC